MRLAVLAVSLASLFPAPCLAQRVAVLLRTEAGSGVDDGMARGFDRVLRERLTALDVVEIEGSVELDLEQVQLALGCIGESAACLGAVAAETESEVLVFASIERTGSTYVVSAQRFDREGDSLRRAVRTVDSDAGVLEAADPLVRELWDLPAPTPLTEGGGDDPVDRAPPRAGISPWPPVLLGLGAATLVAGGVALGIGFGDRDAYVAARPTNDAEADAARARLDAAQAELAAGSVLLAVGGALAVAATGWLLGAGNEDGTSPLAVAPWASPDGAGVLAVGTLPGGVL